MVWGFLISIITIFLISIDVLKFLEGYIYHNYDYLIQLSSSKDRLQRLGRLHGKKDYGSAAVEGLAIGSIIAWAPFLSFKLLFWIGSGFVETDDEDEKPTD